MASPTTFPYTYYSCSCAGITSVPPGAKRNSQITPADADEDTAFDPSSPIANYSLYPLENLLYCNDCKELRCPRCCTDEIITWYCPQCLFEVTGMGSRTDGGRCNRACFQCPLCTAPLTAHSLSASSSDAADADVTKGGPYILLCGYCQWSTLDIGIQFPKFSNLSGQLARVKNGGQPRKTASTAMSPLANLDKTPEKPGYSPSGFEISPDLEEKEGMVSLDHDELFANLANFYKNQLAESANGSGQYAGLNLDSPSSITRIMNLYTSRGPLKKLQPMRSAQSPSEGFAIIPHTSANTNHNPEISAIQKLKTQGWDSTASTPQQTRQKSPVRFLSDLRPLGMPLRTKRAKRCRACKLILYRPDPKPTSHKSKINQVALNHIPKLSLRLLSVPAPTFANLITLPNPSIPSEYELLKPGKTTHVLLTLTNPLFDAIKVTLAAPAVLSNGTKVTILCPQFDVGANTDIWDEALGTSAASKRRTQFLSGEAGTIEAGKPWEKGRNYTSVIIEVVPGLGGLGGKEGNDEGLLEMPMFVRCEYESEGDAGAGQEKKGKEKVVEKREEAFWTVLGIGKIAI